MRRREVLVRQYTPAAWRSRVAWHSYWDQHGGYDIDDEQLMAASPPRPRSDHSTVRLTWGQVRKWVREDTATPRQENQAKASRDTSRTPRVGARRRGCRPGRGTSWTAPPSSCATGSPTGPPAARWRTRSGPGRTRPRRGARSRSARCSLTLRAPASTSTLCSGDRAPCSRSHTGCCGGDTSLPPACDARDTSPRPARDGRVCVVLRANAEGRSPRGEVLLEAVPAGRVPRQAEGPARPVSLPAARDVRVVPKANAARRSPRGEVLLEALSAGRVPL